MRGIWTGIRPTAPYGGAGGEPPLGGRRATAGKWTTTLDFLIRNATVWVAHTKHIEVKELSSLWGVG